jgi:hypothetical protein
MGGGGDGGGGELELELHERDCIVLYVVGTEEFLQ